MPVTALVLLVIVIRNKVSRVLKVQHHYINVIMIFKVIVTPHITVN